MNMSKHRVLLCVDCFTCVSSDFVSLVCNGTSIRYSADLEKDSATSIVPYREIAMTIPFFDIIALQHEGFPTARVRFPCLQIGTCLRFSRLTCGIADSGRPSSREAVAKPGNARRGRTALLRPWHQRKCGELSDQAGKVVLVNIWASGVGLASEMPKLDRLYRERKG